MKLLIVEDNAGVRRVIRSLLARAAHQAIHVFASKKIFRSLQNPSLGFRLP
jgi:hypothetical protein